MIAENRKKMLLSNFPATGWLFLPFLHTQVLLRKIYRKLLEALFRQVTPPSVHNNHCHTQGILGKDLESTANFASNNRSISSKDREQNRVEWEVALWGNRRILCLKIFAITDGGSSHYQDVQGCVSLQQIYGCDERQEIEGYLWRWSCLLCPRKGSGPRWWRPARHRRCKLSKIDLNCEEL